MPAGIGVLAHPECPVEIVVIDAPSEEQIPDKHQHRLEQPEHRNHRCNTEEDHKDESCHGAGNGCERNQRKHHAQYHKSADGCNDAGNAQYHTNQTADQEGQGKGSGNHCGCQLEQCSQTAGAPG